jgi:hypothetical protein
MPSSTSAVRLRGSSRVSSRAPWRAWSKPPGATSWSAASPPWPKQAWPRSWPVAMALVRGTLRARAWAMVAAIRAVCCMWVARVT